MPNPTSTGQPDEARIGHRDCSGRDLRPLRQALAKVDVLAAHLLDQDDGIVRSQADFLDDEPVERGEQREALLLRATRDEGQFEGPVGQRPPHIGAREWELLDRRELNGHDSPKPTS